jgi:hypothetical protein
MGKSLDTSQKNRDNLINNLKLVLIVLLFATIFLRYLYPIYHGRDTDIFWHIKTGEVIFQEHGIPSTDPFTFTPKDPVREKVLLHSYWLADLLLFLFYKFFGFAGLAFLRSTIICLTVLFVYLSLRKRGFFISIILSFMLGLAFMPTSAIRPNLFSFLFAAAMIFFLERYREVPKKKYQIGLFIIMVMWANMHGGYIIGVGLLLIYIVTEAIVLLISLKKKKSIKKSLSFCVTGVIAALVTLINPLGVGLFAAISTRYLNPGKKLLVSRIETEMGLFRILKYYPDEMIYLSLVIVGFILVYTALHITRKRAGLAEISIVLALLMLSIVSVRALPIFLVAGLILSGGGKSLPLFTLIMNKKTEIILLLLLTATLGFFAVKELPKEHPGTFSETDSIYLSTGTFMGENKINGNMLNQELMGNFIIFELFPQYRVFTDSRYLNVDVFFDAYDMFYAIKEPTPEKDSAYTKSLTEASIANLKGEGGKEFSEEYWYRLLDKYKIDFIVGKVTHPRSGQFFPLFLKLMHEDTWKLVYSDGNAVIMIKNNGKNDALIKKFPPQNKSLLYDEAIKETITKNTSQAYETLAYAFLMKGDIKNADIFAKNALAISKNRNIAQACLHFINLLKQQNRQAD